MEIFVFGDSIAYGAWDNEGGWVAWLQRLVFQKINALNNEYYHNIYNLSIPGENAVGVLSRLDNEVTTRLRKRKECALIFSISTNDSQWLLAEQANKFSLEAFEKNMRDLVAKAKTYTDRIIFVGSLLADDPKVNPCPWAPEKAFITEHMQRYDAVVQKIASEMSLQYIDVATPFIAAGGISLLDDGIHPTTAGHHVIFETVRDALVEKGLV